MVQKIVDIGSLSLNGADGDTAREAFTKVNENFTEVYTSVGSISNKVDKVVGKSLVDDTEIAKLATVEANATANQTDAYLLNRTNHTGAQPISTITGLVDELDTFEKELVEGSGIVIDRTDPNAPVISAAGGAGLGDVVGPGSAVVNGVALFDNISGKVVKDGGVLGSAAFTNSNDYATSAQGVKADTAVQPSTLESVVSEADALLRQDLANDTDPTKGAALLGFKGRTVREKLLTMISVADEGAVGDGVADDTAAIQAALNSSVRVQFTPGASYLVSSALTLSNNHILQFNGASIRQVTDQTPILDASGLSNITIEGGNFIGKSEASYVNTPSSQAIAIKAPSVDGLYIRNNRFENFYYSALMVGLTGNEIEFSNNVVVGPGASVLGVDVNRRNTVGVTVLGTNVRISNNDISQTATGVIIGQGSSSVSIRGNLLHDFVNEHGIYADTGMRNLVISNNIITNTGTSGVGIKVQHYDSFGVQPENIVISGNTVRATGSDGILFINSLGTNIYATGVSITGNSVYQAGQHGIDLRYARGITVSGNSIDQSTLNGIYVSKCSVLDVVGNSLRLTGESGVFDDGTSSDVTYANNIINSPGTDQGVGHSGFSVSGCSEHIFINNVVRGTAVKTAYGLFISGGTLTTTEVRGNSFTGSAQLGYRFPVAGGQIRYIGQNKVSGGAGNNVGQSVPEALVRGEEDTNHYGTAAPTSGTWAQGVKVIARYPAASGHIGWVCVVGGTPGTWKTFGPVSA